MSSWDRTVYSGGKLSDNCDHSSNKCNNATGAIGAVYGFAVLGAAVYFIQQSTSFWGGVWGLLKAIAWPAILMYKLLEILKM
ncbi:hypothetical protein KKH27_13660 [bacterium]|nr:hypothetical protein [bacterium]MBU1984510.1 hypothetical protein [bacterium]